MEAKSKFTSRIVHITGPEGSLEGELLCAAGARCGIIIIPGSGPTDRDGNSPAGLASDSYKLLATDLAKAGFAVLRIDKRGMFGSHAAVTDANAVSLQDYADDLLAWTDYLKRETSVHQIWAAGHSEGGLVSLLAARTANALDGLVLLATPGRCISDILRSQFSMHAMDGELLQEAEAHITALERGNFIDGDDIHPGLLPVFHPTIQGFLHSLMAQDPVSLLKETALPALVLQGGVGIFRFCQKILICCPMRDRMLSVDFFRQ